MSYIQWRGFQWRDVLRGCNVAADRSHGCSVLSEHENSGRSLDQDRLHPEAQKTKTRRNHSRYKLLTEEYTSVLVKLSYEHRLRSSRLISPQGQMSEQDPKPSQRTSADITKNQVCQERRLTLCNSTVQLHLSRFVVVYLQVVRV